MNVLMLLTDQHRHDAVGYYNPNIRTPNLDNLRESSTNCSVTYTQSPQCQPSRASLFTGRYPTAHRLWWNSIQLSRTEKTLANHLRAVGYHTGYVGKLHFSEKRNETELANHFGFDASFLSNDWYQLCSLHRKQHIASDYYKILLTDKWYGRLAAREWQHEDVITNKAIEFIQKTRSPYFLVVSFNGPHPPYAAPPPYTYMYDPNSFSGPVSSQTYAGVQLTVQDWQFIKSQYYGVISWIDDNIGKILKAVDLNNTVVIFTSDHGDILGDHGYFSKGPFAYEGNVRVPLLLRFPDISTRSYNFIVQHIDIIPTVLEYLGYAAPMGLQGKSVLSGIKENKQINEFALSMIGHCPRLRMIRRDNLKYWIYGDEEVCFDLHSDEDARVVDNATIQKMRYCLLRALIAAEDPLPVLGS